MKQFILIITCIGVIQSNLYSQYTAALLDSMIVKKMEEYHFPGLTACIIEDDQIIWKGNFGKANLEQNKLVTDSTLFTIASVSKTITGVALMQLWEKELFELDDDINNYLPFEVRNPSFPNDPVTFRMLLSHVSSIKDNWNILPSLNCEDCDSPIELRTFLENYLLPGGNYYTSSCWWGYAPRTENNYSNVAIALVGYLVETIADTSFEDYCYNNIFSPLGMSETSWFLRNLVIDRIAVPYQYSGGKYFPSPHYGGPIYPAGRLRTTRDQLAQFLLAFWQKDQIDGVRILESATVDTMMTIQYPEINKDQGLIWFINKQPIPDMGQRFLCWHLGTLLEGFNALVGYTWGEKEKVGGILLANGQNDNGIIDIGLELIAYGMLYNKIYARNINLNSNFMYVDKDTLTINTGFSNPENNNFVSNAIIVSSDSSYKDSVVLYDDGHHGDHQADDGIWGNFIEPLSWEDVFTVDISTKDLDSGEYLYQNARARFTTCGPVVFDHFEFISSDTIPNPGDQIRIRIFLRNDGSVESASNITAKLSSPDTSVTVNTIAYLWYGDIGAGEINESSSGYLISFKEPFDKNVSQVPFALDIRSGDYSFWIDTTFSIEVDIDQKGKPIPEDFALYQNYPNPFNPVTMINYQLPMTNEVDLSIYNLLGQKVATLVDKKQTAGSYEVQWDASGFASGIYFYRLITNEGFSETRKLLYLK